jgi:hypothetical protein
MRFILFISLFLCCYSGSVNTINSDFRDRVTGKSEAGIPEINLSSNIEYVQYLIIDDRFYFDTQSDNDILFNRVEYRYRSYNQLIKKIFHKNYPFCFSKSTDPLLELDIPPPFYS